MEAGSEPEPHGEQGGDRQENQGRHRLVPQRSRCEGQVRFQVDGESQRSGGYGARESDDQGSPAGEKCGQGAVDRVEEGELSSGPGGPGAQLGVAEGSGQGQQAAGHPDSHEPRGIPDLLGDESGGGVDACSDDVSHNQEDGGSKADFPKELHSMPAAGGAAWECRRRSPAGISVPPVRRPPGPWSPDSGS